jgi:hypothetical protein
VGIKTPLLNPTKGEVTALKEKRDEKQCAKIADFLVEGKKGMDLEAADAGLGTGRGTEINVSVLRACFDLVRRYLPTCRTFSLNYQYRSLNPSLLLSSFRYNCVHLLHTLIYHTPHNTRAPNNLFL